MRACMFEKQKEKLVCWKCGKEYSAEESNAGFLAQAYCCERCALQDGHVLCEHGCFKPCPRC